MAQAEQVAVTGAFSYTGKYIAQHLLANGYQVLNLTRSPNRKSEFGERLRSAPFNFENPAVLAASLEQCTTLYNTYWIRFNYHSWTFDQAVENTRIMVVAAREAGVQRIVHVSVTNPSPDSPLAYFRGKAAVEEIVRNSKLTYAIIRPTLIFGQEDLLLNNITYLLRKFPFFAMPGNGNYRLQPVSADETADLCVQAGKASENMVRDAAGPEIMTFREMVVMIGKSIGKLRLLVNVPASLSLGFSRLLGLALEDIPLTREELLGLMDEVLVSKEPPFGKIKLADWLKVNVQNLGLSYVSEIQRNYSVPPD